MGSGSLAHTLDRTGDRPRRGPVWPAPHASPSRASRGFGVGQPITIAASTTMPSLHPLRSARLVLGAQIAMCLVMTAALVAMYS